MKRRKKSTVDNRVTLFTLIVICVGIGIAVFYSTKDTVSVRRSAHGMTPKEVLKDLIEGNKRFYIGAAKTNQSLLAISKKASKKGQFPKAVILACMDSRSIPELIFDQSIADIFTLRVAGNIVNQDMLASMEFATKIAGAKLIVVMGHTQCGAIQAACSGGAEGNLESLVDAIKPAVRIVRERISDLDCNNDAFINAIALQNVRNVKEEVLQGSPVIRKMVSDGTIGIVGALHNLRSGIVTFE